MTSNIGSQAIGELTAHGAEDFEIEAQVRAALKQHFRPELLNRIDEVSIFHQLSREQIRLIVDIQLQPLIERMRQRDVVLQVTSAARNELSDLGYDPSFGARPLRRVIQQRVENEIATRLLSDHFAPGSTLRVNIEGKSFTFEALPSDAVDAVGAALGEASNNRGSNGATHSGHEHFSAGESLVRHDELRLMPVLIKNSRVGCSPRATRGSVSASWRQDTEVFCKLEHPWSN